MHDAVISHKELPMSQAAYRLTLLTLKKEAGCLRSRLYLTTPTNLLAEGRLRGSVGQQSPTSSRSPHSLCKLHITAKAGLIAVCHYLD